MAGRVFTGLASSGGRLGLCQTSVLFSGCYQNVFTNQQRFVRYRRVRVNIDIPWTPKVEWHPPMRSMILQYLPRNTGDLETFHPVEYRKTLNDRGQSFPPHLKYSTLLEKADEMTKAILSVDMLGNEAVYGIYSSDLTQRVQRHPLDSDSLPAQSLFQWFDDFAQGSILAELTARIRWQQFRLFKPEAKLEDAPITMHGTIDPNYFFRERMRRRQFVRLALRDAVEARRIALEKLRQEDYQYFEFVLERLRISYKPLPVLEHKIRRKECIRRLASEYVLLLKKERRNAYAMELASQQESFLNEKIETLKWIQAEEQDLMLEPTVTVEVLANAAKQLEEYKKVAAAKASALGEANFTDKNAPNSRMKRPEDVTKPSKFPVGLWPYDAFQLDENVLVKAHHNEFKSFPKPENWDERLYDTLQRVD
ncbi:unnamed protein product [Notodromas monacha]|uniref:28S ribosomal protein S15, mitochondrial n=1 Tax=Notodromas monacha TaxID=399045 RepID=A0A7R9BH04_9CRUS|nr:unnamed protein product [Notodromas monacha]CAG0915300.1 unnamed protein product [Notodromas monacha]